MKVITSQFADDDFNERPLSDFSRTEMRGLASQVLEIKDNAEKAMAMISNLMKTNPRIGPNEALLHTDEMGVSLEHYLGRLGLLE